ncbi:MAG: 50S ribosomal protein L4 [Actinobacteria bacterium]|nr:50S ribosomal protein L4 [Actinomycetota bacterium]
MASAATATTKLEAPVLGKSGKVSLDPAVFGEEFNGALVHEVVRSERNARRSGNASTKLRGEVAMTGAKAWRQKGTGRARIGAQSAGHRRGGGVTFGPKPRNYTFKVNRKARRKALRAALSLHAGRGSLAIVESAAFGEPNTNQAAGHLNGWQPDGSVVVLTAGTDDRTLALSFRNIGRVRAVLTPDQLGVYEITAAQNLVISQDALESLKSLANTEVDRASKKTVEAVAVRGAKAAPAAKAAPKPAAVSEEPQVDEPSTDAAADGDAEEKAAE